MTESREDFLALTNLPDVVQKIRARTPARLLQGRTGAAYRTATQMELREAHAAARDAVRVELDLERQFDAGFRTRWEMFEVCSAAKSKDEYLLHPQLGRTLPQQARATLTARCVPHADLQIAIGDGLSVTAVAAQVPQLLPALIEGARKREWTTGAIFVVRHCRVGILNEIGELLGPKVAVLLIGERPGLATAESLSAYMAYRPRRDHTDADRNLISNIHSRGVRPGEAAERIVNFAGQLMAAQLSGTQVREQAPNLEV